MNTNQDTTKCNKKNSFADNEKSDEITTMLYDDDDDYLDWNSDDETFYNASNNSIFGENTKIIDIDDSINISQKPIRTNSDSNSCVFQVPKPKRKLQSGFGEETKKLQSHMDYRVPYYNCFVYPLLKNLKNEELKKLGTDYNEHFKKEIKARQLPKFSRTEKRNKGIAIWFFEHVRHTVYGWLQNEIQKKIDIDTLKIN